jgi:hypothetical protein
MIVLFWYVVYEGGQFGTVIGGGQGPTFTINEVVDCCIARGLHPQKNFCK